jgi:hypothetical protein
LALGLRANWPQFALHILINAFVGGMVGIERTIVPLIRIGITLTTLILSFIKSFGDRTWNFRAWPGVNFDRLLRQHDRQQHQWRR